MIKDFCDIKEQLQVYKLNVSFLEKVVEKMVLMWFILINRVIDILVFNWIMLLGNLGFLIYDVMMFFILICYYLFDLQGFKWF